MRDLGSVQHDPAAEVRRIAIYDMLSDEEKELVAQNVTVRKFSKDEVIHSCTGDCLGLIFVISGGIRVSIISEEGRALTLYKLAEGDTCVVSAACVLHEIRLESAITASEPTTLLILNSRTLSKLVEENLRVRCYSYEIATKRFSSALFVLQEMILAGFDVRLARYLLECAEKSGSPELRMTQEEVATEVNSAREVVARMLRQFVMDGLVELKRGVILLKDIQGLQDIVG
ncbi:MAG: Crp/Fnr family transcriptional regulator [Lachnospiraceae bacterium]|nr:Crp/Fnr family transcriptional regulator [Lachnospiraceae bacterium]